MSLTQLPRKQVVSQELIDNIRRQLDLAEQGHITDLAFIACHVDDDLPYYRATSFADGWRLIGAVEYVKNAIILGMNE